MERLREAAEFAVEWVVCLDGPSESVVGPDVVLTLPAHRGQATARNWALTHAAGNLVFTLDADDELVPEGLIAACESLASDPMIGWVAGMRTTPDGEQLWYPLDEERDFPAGDTAALLNGWVALFHPNAIVARRELMLGVGGWFAVPTGEDWVMAVNLNRAAAGRFLPQVLSTYRVWEGQVTRETSFKHERAMVRKFVRAIEESRSSWPCAGIPTTTECRDGPTTTVTKH